jgi:hypothetical protein
MLKVWRWAALAVAAIPGAALADAAQSSAFKLPSNVAVNVSGGAVNPDGSGLKGNTSVDIQTAAGDTKLSGTFATAPPDPSLPANRMDRKVGVDSKFNGPAGVDLSIQASSEVHNTRQEGVLVPTGLASTSATTETDSATAKVQSHPLQGVGVTVGVSQSRAMIAQDNVPVGGRAQSSAVVTDNRQAFASADWTPVPFLQLEAGTKNETMQVSSRGASEAGDQYRYTEPSASATAQLWHGAQMQASSEDAVSPVNPYDFAALAQAAGPQTDLRVTPNREWRNQASITQNFDNGAKLSATVTQARIESTTELGLTASGVAVPTAVSGGARQQMDASITMPLSDIGLPNTTIASHATIRQSQVRDPITGRLRRASGEIPREANVRLTHEDHAHHLEWGVRANLGTEQSLYQPAQVTALRTESGVGAFLTYKPGKYAVSLNADGLLGGARSQTDTIYNGTRTGTVETTNRTSDASPLVSVSVSQTF